MAEDPFRVHAMIEDLSPKESRAIQHTIKLLRRIPHCGIIEKAGDGRLQPGRMGNDDNQDRERAVRDRIASFMQADEQVQRKQVTHEELQTLRVAARRLDQLLVDAAADEQARRERATEEEVQALRAAVARLDQLLTIIARKEAAPELKPVGAVVVAGAGATKCN